MEGFMNVFDEEAELAKQEEATLLAMLAEAGLTVEEARAYCKVIRGYDDKRGN